ncbi:MFS transporter [Halococcus thailandensis]|uniref:Major facilitator superfamily protein n=1 Tax=Halococcus thailandensis JCM 13552 TaxID=1227457 RepID=M0N6V9_9EURY|nr:MFS transporter [Halococcus thailandensis]EMA52864.1 major facilitator superfamily protein [Halococcus thailandensis JCM 13552]
MSANESGSLRSGTVPWQASNLHVVLASSMVGIMGVSLLTPVLPQLKGVFGVGDAAIGLIVPAFTIPGVVLTPFIGLLADRIGRRWTLVPLLVLFGIAGAGVAFASTFRQVLLLRVLQGVGGSALIMLAITLIGDYYDDPRRSAVIGINGGAIGSSGAIFPFVGGTLAAVRWQVPFLFFGVAILVGLYALSVLDEPTIGEQQSVREYFSRMRGVLAYPRAVAANLTVLVHFFMFYGMLTAIPLVLGDSYGLSSSRIGIVLATLSVASAACNTQYGRISTRVGPVVLIAVGFLLYGGSLLGLATQPSLALVVVCLLAFGTGVGLITPSLDSTIVGLVPEELRAGLMSVRTSMLRLGQTIGPVAFTAAASLSLGPNTIGFPVVFAGIGCLAILGGGIAVVAR